MARKSADTAIEETPETVAEPDPDFPDLQQHDKDVPRHVFAEEPRRQGFLARWMTRLAGLVLVLLAGAAGALWLGPKVAPSLPAGIGAMLAPGADAGAEIAALRNDLTARIDALPVPAGTAETEALVNARVAELAGTIVVPDTTAIEARLAALEQEVAQVGGAVTALQNAPMTTTETGTVTADAVARINALTAQIASLKGEVTGLTGAQATLSGRVDGLAAELASVPAAAATVPVLDPDVQAQLAEIGAALTAGIPFEKPLSVLEGKADIPPALTENAPVGVASLAALRESFPSAAHEALQAAVMAEAAPGAMARIGAFARAQVVSRSLEPVQGTDADAVLSRMQAGLNADDLSGVLAEAEGLPAVSGEAMAAWLAQAQAREAAAGGFEQLRQSLLAAR